jgi:hypothetical protein
MVVVMMISHHLVLDPRLRKLTKLLVQLQHGSQGLKKSDSCSQSFALWAQFLDEVYIVHLILVPKFLLWESL